MSTDAGRARMVVATHGGAGSWRGDLNAGSLAVGRGADAGYQVLRAGGSALDAVVAAVCVLEDDPNLNAGTGAVLTSAQTLELDAAVMDGASRTSGAVGALSAFRHPVLVARAVLATGNLALLVGAGADAFAVEAGFAPVDPETMIVAAQRLAVQTGVDNGNTVGAVACDADGNVAAATSTGGISGQRPGRVGDSPVVGAGTYADATAAVSCTGQGEAFARALAAYTVCDRVATGSALDAAVAAQLARVRDDFGGVGGMIAVTPDGRVVARCTTRVMPHAVARHGGTVMSA